MKSDAFQHEPTKVFKVCRCSEPSFEDYICKKCNGYNAYHRCIEITCKICGSTPGYYGSAD